MSEARLGAHCESPVIGEVVLWLMAVRAGDFAIAAEALVEIQAVSELGGKLALCHRVTRIARSYRKPGKRQRLDECVLRRRPFGGQGIR